MPNLRKPSGRKRKPTTSSRLNLIPVLDSVFIFIFFLLMSSNFVKIFEIGSDVPIVSTSPPKNKKKPLALTLTIEKKRIRLATGVPSIVRKNFSVDKDGKYDLTSLHNYLLNLKRANPDERNVILIPKTNLNYEALVEIMDSIRMIQRTDESIYVKQKDGNEKRVKTLFDNIVFGNLLS